MLFSTLLEPSRALRASLDGRYSGRPAHGTEGRSPRLKVVCVVRQSGDYLLAVGTDPVGPRTFLVPVGGGIEFGELALAAAVREVREEIGLDIETPLLLGVLEQIFTWNGAPSHEVVFCFLGTVPTRDQVPSHGRESNGEIIPLRWVTWEALCSSAIPVSPDGILRSNLDQPICDVHASGA